MNNWTPGPWTWELHESHHYESGPFKLASPTEDVLYGCYTCSALFVTPDDATLITAAPDLLAELERIVNMDTGTLGHEYETEWQTARAAIAKARGRE